MDSNSYFIAKEDTQKNSTFAERVRREKRAILYELVPPPISRGQSDIEKSLELIVSLFRKLPVDGINIPEVREEKRNGERSGINTEKLEPRVLSSYLRSQGFHNVIINRPVVYLPWADQRRWLKETYDKDNIRNFVFVGGESSKVNYPGLSVTQAVKAVTQTFRSEFPDIFLGGITIPTRKGEAERLFQKSLAGIEFFTTQILYESESIKQLLQDYWDLCLEDNRKPAMICLSFAPATSKKDIELLSWLGVKVPKSTLETLTTGWLGMGWRSLEVSKNILEDVFQFVKARGIRVPIGLNVGYINRHNFEFSIAFLEQLAAFYSQNRILDESRASNFDTLRHHSQYAVR